MACCLLLSVGLENAMATQNRYEYLISVTHNSTISFELKQWTLERMSPTRVVNAFLNAICQISFWIYFFLHLLELFDTLSPKTVFHCIQPNCSNGKWLLSIVHMFDRFSIECNKILSCSYSWNKNFWFFNPKKHATRWNICLVHETDWRILNRN